MLVLLNNRKKRTTKKSIKKQSTTTVAVVRDQPPPISLQILSHNHAGTATVASSALPQQMPDFYGLRMQPVLSHSLQLHSSADIAVAGDDANCVPGNDSERYSRPTQTLCAPRSLNLESVMSVSQTPTIIEAGPAAEGRDEGDDSSDSGEELYAHDGDAGDADGSKETSTGATDMNPITPE